METEQQHHQQPMMSQQEPESPDTAIHDQVLPAESTCQLQDTVAVPSVQFRIVTAVQCLGFDCSEDSFDLNTCIVNCVPELCTTVPQGHDPPTIRSSPNKCWEKNYSVLSFLMNGQLFAEYKRVANMLGLPSCSKCQWVRIVDWTNLHVTQLAE